MVIKKRFKPMWVLVMLAFLFGCAGQLNERPEAPNVSLSNINIIEFGLLEQRYGLRLRIQNPNSFALPLAGMNYQLYINGEPFAHGVSNDRVTIPGFGENVVNVDVVSNLNQLSKQLVELGSSSRQALQYRLEGKVKLDNFVSSIPFNYEGEVKFDLEPK